MEAIVMVGIGTDAEYASICFCQSAYTQSSIQGFVDTAAETQIPISDDLHNGNCNPKIRGISLKNAEGKATSKYVNSNLSV